MPLNHFDLTKPVEWKEGDYFACQKHDLAFDDAGIGKTTATDKLYDGRVLEVNENGRITKAILQEPGEEEGTFKQHTMPLKKTESIMKIDEKGVTALDTYEPFYVEEKPQLRYLFTIIAGARHED